MKAVDVKPFVAVLMFFWHKFYKITFPGPSRDVPEPKWSTARTPRKNMIIFLGGLCGVARKFYITKYKILSYFNDSKLLR